MIHDTIPELQEQVRQLQRALQHQVSQTTVVREQLSTLIRFHRKIMLENEKLREGISNLGIVLDSAFPAVGPDQERPPTMWDESW